MLTGSQALVNDPYYNDVVLHLRGYDAQSGQVFKDYSKYNRAITANGNVAHSTAQKKYGNSSIYFDGNGDYLSILNNTDFNLTASLKFSFDVWVFIGAYPSDFYEIIDKDGVNSVSYAQYNLSISSSGIVRVFLGNGMGVSPSGQSFLTSNPINLNTWNFIQVIRDDSILKIGVNGNIVLQQSITVTMYEGSRDLLIGYHQNHNSYLNGYIEDLRITKGIARPIEVPTQPFPNW